MSSENKGFFKKYIKKRLKNGYWWFYGPALKNPRLPVDPGSLLFICKGNVCRSVFAQGLAVKMAGEREISIAVFDSAGLEVSRAISPPQEALIAAREFGVILDDYRSKSISRAIVGSFDMVIAMETRQLKVLGRLFPEQRDRFFLLALFDKDNSNSNDFYSMYNIEDPFGKDLPQFRGCYERIEKCLADFFCQLSGVAEKLEKEERKYD